MPKGPASDPGLRKIAVSGPKLDLTIVLLPGGTSVRGHVGDAIGGSVEGAFVRVGDAVAFSDTAGYFSMSVRRAGSVSYTAAADGYGVDSGAVSVPGPSLEILLLPEVSVSGLVLDQESGDAVGGAHVVLDGSEFRTTSDDDGHFELEGLTAGLHQVSATANGRLGVSQPLLLSSGESRTGLVVRVKSRPPTYATVLEMDSGLPCASPIAEVPGARATFDGDGEGRIDFSRLAPGSHAVSLRCPADVRSGAFTVTVPGGPYEWRVPKILSARGEVVDADETPIPDARVTAFLGSEIFATTTDVHGGFELDVRTQGSVRIRVQHDDYVTVWLDADTGSAEDLRIQMLNGGTVEGVVVDGRGEPVDFATVTAYPEDSSFSARSTSSDQNGEYRISGLESGTWTLWPSYRRGTLSLGERSSRLRDATAIVVNDVSVHQAKLVLDAEATALKGNVVSPDGDAEPGVLVSVVAPEGGRLIRDITDDDGAFAFELRAGADYFVSVLAPDGRRARIGGVEPGADLEVKLEPAVQVCGVARSDGGAPLLDFTVEISGHGMLRFLEEDGHWCFPSVSTGERSVTVRQGDREVTRDLVVQAGVEPIEIRL